MRESKINFNPITSRMTKQELVGYTLSVDLKLFEIKKSQHN